MSADDPVGATASAKSSRFRAAPHIRNWLTAPEPRARPAVLSAQSL